MKKMFKKCVTILLTVILLMSTAISVDGATISTEEPVSFRAELSEKDLLISEEVAEYIAQYFIEDIVATGMTNWDSNTSILNCMPTYDADGETLTSYTFELTRGYVMVAPYIDMPSPILEWSDEGEPVYADFGTISPDKKVIYLGPVDYYLDSGGEQLQSREGYLVPRTAASGSILDSRDEKNVSYELRREIVELKKEAFARAGSGISPFSDNYEGGYITDAAVFAHNVYGGNWTCIDWENNWEDYANFYTQDEVSYDLACGPIAITNAIKMYGNKYNKSTIKNASESSIFSKIRTITNASGERYYKDNIGIEINMLDEVGDYIEKAFSKYSASPNVLGPFDCTEYNIQRGADSNHLMYINLDEYMQLGYVETPYGGPHAVIGYAWSLMEGQGARDNGPFYFIKVCDGVHSSGRYLSREHLEDTVTGGIDTYWEICF